MNLSWLLPVTKGIPVLMYHKVWPGISDNFTITPENLQGHFAYLAAEGYNAISLQQYLNIINGRSAHPEKTAALNA